MHILINRIYNEAPAGYRVLVDRLWPRGISRQKAALDEWCKTLAPSPGLRQWFNHEPARWPEFQKDYTAELSANRPEAAALLKRAGKGPLVLLYGAKDTEHTNALVLQKFLESMK
jgi:uncharacterized protein YeaO (DUF488 family)